MCKPDSTTPGQSFEEDKNLFFDHRFGLLNRPVISDSTGKKLGKAPQILSKNIKCEKVNMMTDLVVRFTYFVMFLFARIREYLQKKEILTKMGHKELEKHADFVPIIGGPESLFVRNIYRLASDVINHVVASVPGTKMVVKERVTDNFGWSYRLTGKKIDTTNMGSYNYLGFAQNTGPVTDYAASFVDDFGVYSSASICGAVPRHVKQLEAKISGFIGAEDAIVFPMGFGTNSMNIPSLIGKGGLILSDELNHASIVLGCRLSGAKIAVFKHNDPEDLELKLTTFLSASVKSKNPYNKILIIVEGIYSMEGTICNLAQFIQIKKKYKASLFIDEAHSIGALGPNGKGITDYFDVDPRDVDVMMGTLTKSFAGAGGYIAGSKTLIDHLRKTSHDTFYGSFMSPAVVGQIIGAIDCLEQVDEQGETDAQKRAKKLQQNTRYLRALLQKHGFLIYGHEHSPVVPVMVFHLTKGSYFITECLKRGISLVGVCFPAVPLTKCRIRFCLSSAHTKEDIDDVIHMVNQVADEVDVKFALDTRHDFEIEY